MNIIGFYKNEQLYRTAIWQHIKHWKDAAMPIAVRFEKYQVPVWHRGHIVYYQIKFRAVATFQAKDGRILSRQCSAKNWANYLVEEDVHIIYNTEEYHVTPIEGSKSTNPRTYYTSYRGCSCNAWQKKAGLIDGLCKHQLMLYEELFGATQYATAKKIEEKKPAPKPQPKPSPAPQEEEVNVNEFATVALDFSKVKPRPPEPPKKYRLRLLKSDTSQLYHFYNLDTKKYWCTGLERNEVFKTAKELADSGHSIDGLYSGKHWIFWDYRWIEFKEFQKMSQQAKASLGI